MGKSVGNIKEYTTNWETKYLDCIEALEQEKHAHKRYKTIMEGKLKFCIHKQNERILEIDSWKHLCEVLCNQLNFGYGVGCELCIHEKDHSKEFEDQGGCHACINHGAGFFALNKNLFCKGEK